MIRNLEVIGEATKNLSGRTRRRFRKVAWTDMARLRDLAIHPYGKVLAEGVWGIVVKDLPGIRHAVAGVVISSGKAGRVK